MKRYAKIALNPFVSRLHFCADAVVFRDVWYLADVAYFFAVFGAFIHDSHVARIESGRGSEQLFDDGFRGGDGA